jgi:hypothetical protein
MAIRTVFLVRDATQIFKSLCIGRKILEEEEKEELESSWIHKETKVTEVLANLRRKEVNLLIGTCKYNSAWLCFFDLRPLKFCSPRLLQF